MTVDETIQQHGARAVSYAAFERECGTLGLETADAVEDVYRISYEAFQHLSAAKIAAPHWEASQDLYKSREPVQWDDVDYQVGPRMSHESEAGYLQR